MPNVKTILQRLLENRVDFVLVGGLAATMYGASTVTYDVDVCFNFSLENVQRLLHALEGLHPKVRTQTDWCSLYDTAPEKIVGLKNLYLQTDCGGLDLLGSLTEFGDYQEVKRHSLEITVFDKPCGVITIESLIKVKEQMKRPKDKQVVIELKMILEKLKG